MAGSATNVVQSKDIIIYSEPYASANVLPTDSAWGTSFGGSWRDMGYTDGGVNVGIGIEYADVVVDQEVDPVLIIGTARNTRLTTNLAEPTTANLKDAIGGQATLTTVAATSGVRGHIDADLNAVLSNNYQSVAYDVKHPGDGEAIRIIVWRGQGRGSPAITFSKDAKALIPYEVQGFPDPANANRVLRWRDISAALP